MKLPTTGNAPRETISRKSSLTLAQMFQEYHHAGCHLQHLYIQHNNFARFKSSYETLHNPRTATAHMQAAVVVVQIQDNKTGGEGKTF